MSNNVSITVVMAVYNAERYLHRSISSVLNQTSSNWELICVDDGSTDSSYDILCKYQKLDSRIKVLQQSNSGPAAAREKAYLGVVTTHAMILDADDELSSDFLEKVYNLLGLDVDCIIPNALVEHGTGSYTNWFAAYGFKDGQSVSSIDAFERSLISPSVHGWCLYKTSLLKKYAIGGNAHYNGFNEDEYIQRVLQLNSSSILFSEATYIYHYNGNSITKGFCIRHLGYIATCRKIIDLAIDNKLPARLIDLTYEYMFRTIVQLRYRQICSCSNMSSSDYQYISSQLKSNYMFCMANKKRIHYADKSHPNLYRIMLLRGFNLLSLFCWVKSKSC